MNRGIDKDEAVDNLRWWNALKDPDPAYVKKIPGGAKLSSIDPMHRAEIMTHVFGPIGIGWGLEVDPYSREDVGSKVLIFVRARAWFKDPATGDIGYTAWHTGGTELNGRGDDDSVKSAETDAIGKTLSYLGVCASVYLGKHDADKYQRNRPAKVERKSPPKEQPQGKPTSWIDEQLEVVKQNDPGSYVIPFGKHEGKTVDEAYAAGYLGYMVYFWTTKPPRDSQKQQCLQMFIAYLQDRDPQQLETNLKKAEAELNTKND